MSSHLPLVADLQLPTFDYSDPTLVGERFHEVLGGLRAERWLAAVQPLGYILLDRRAVDEILRTRRARMPAIEILEAQGITQGPIHDQLSGNLINLQGAEHRRLRGLVQAPFMPRAVEALRPSMRGHLDDLLAGADGGMPCDFVAAVAKPYPARMIAEIVGAPIADAARLGEWAYWLQATFDPLKVAGQAGRIEQAAVEFHGYVSGLLATAVQRDGLLGALHAHLDAGEISEQQAISLVSSVLIGGVDTTQAQLGHGVRLLAEHPEQWEALSADPSLVPAAVDEILRYEPIAPFTARLVTEELIHRDVVFPAGTVLFACALTANHDPEVYDEPDRFDITADRGDVRPLTFGAGPHFCLGAALARAELEEALAFLVERVGGIELASPPVYDTPAGVYGLQELAVRFTPPRV